MKTEAKDEIKVIFPIYSHYFYVSYNVLLSKHL
jgi:hypothetical protein